MLESSAPAALSILSMRQGNQTSLLLFSACLATARGADAEREGDIAAGVVTALGTADEVDAGEEAEAKEEEREVFVGVTEVCCGAVDT